MKKQEKKSRRVRRPKASSGKEIKMAKLSTAQERELNKIKAQYEIEVEKELIFWEEELQTAEEQHKHWIAKRVELAKQGFISWYSSNSRTLQKLAEYGYIEYIKLDEHRGTPIDKVKLL